MKHNIFALASYDWSINGASAASGPLCLNFSHRKVN